MSKKAKLNNSKRTEQVTRLPGWILKIKGRWDSRHGQGVCDEYIIKFLQKLSAIESNEIVTAENVLCPHRKEAAVLLTSFAEKKKQYENTPSGMKENTVESIRANRRNMAKRNSAKQVINSAIEKLTVINETIVSVDTVLDERINMTRKKAGEKIRAYVMGVRCGKLKEYNIPEGADDSAREIYHKKHMDLDKQIQDKVNVFMREENVA